MNTSEDESPYLSVLKSIAGENGYVRFTRRLEVLARIRERNGYDPAAFSSIEEWSKACLEGRVSAFAENNSDVAKFLDLIRGRKDFEEFLVEYLRRKFSIHDGDWCAQTIEGQGLTVSDHLMIIATLADNKAERIFYGASSCAAETSKALVPAVEFEQFADHEMPD